MERLELYNHAETNDSKAVHNDISDTTDLPATTDAARLERIRELITSSDISNAEKWEKLTVEERKDVLRKLGTEIAKIAGVEEAKIVFRDMNGYGLYDHTVREIHINRALVDDVGQRTNALDTLNHEYRHAFQYAAVQDPEKYGISKELADEWRSNLPPNGRYLSPYIFGIEIYCKQPIERDAFEWEEKCRGDMI